MPALSSRVGKDGISEPLSVALKGEMRRLLTNLMCYNLSSVCEGVKVSTWRLTFDQQALGAIAFVLAQVCNIVKHNLIIVMFAE